LSAHALDELAGRPLATRIPSRVLWAIALAGLAGAGGPGVLGPGKISAWLPGFVIFCAVILAGHNLRGAGGRFHAAARVAGSWGGSPAPPGYFAQAEPIGGPGVLVSAACLLLSVVQRRLSTPVRSLRRRVASLEGRMRLRDGTEVEVNEAMLRAAPEAALRAM